VESQNTKKLQIPISKARAGNKEAFKEIFEHLNNRLFSYAFAHTSNRDDALDLTQDTFIDIWNGLKKLEYKSDEEFYAYVFVILKRKLFHHHKNNSKFKTVSLEDIHTNQGYEMKINNEHNLLKHINSLGEKYREVLKLRYWSDMKLKDIAVVLQTTENTAKVWHHRALNELRNNLEKYDNI